MIFPASLLAFVAFVAAQAATDPSITTPPSLVQCQPVLLSWTATNSPVFLSIIPGGESAAAAIQDFGSQSGNSLSWVCNLAAGKSVTFKVVDSTGKIGYSAPLTIQSSSDSSCIGQGQPSITSGSAAPSGTGSVSSAPSSAASSSASVSSAASTSAVASSSSVAQSTSIAASTSSVIESVSSVINSVTSTRPASSAASSTRPAASATSASASATPTTNAARSNVQTGFAGLLGLVAAAVVMA